MARGETSASSIDADIRLPRVAPGSGVRSRDTAMIEGPTSESGLGVNPVAEARAALQRLSQGIAAGRRRGDVRNRDNGDSRRMRDSSCGGFPFAARRPTDDDSAPDPTSYRAAATTVPATNRAAATALSSAAQRRPGAGDGLHADAHRATTNSAAARRATTNRTSTDRADAHRTTTDRTDAHRATADRAATHRATTDDGRVEHRRT